MLRNLCLMILLTHRRLLSLQHAHSRSRLSQRLGIGALSEELSTIRGTDVEDHLEKLKDSKIDPYWLRQLSLVSGKRNVARLIPQLIGTNVLGYQSKAAKKSDSKTEPTMFGKVCEEKERHPTKVVLTRCGDFYETFGVDAIMMVAYVGLNPMGNAAKAGCPAVNIQATLDGLTGAGLSVAVMEEFPTNKGQKARSVSQIVNPSTPLYIYRMRQRSGNEEVRYSKPAIGIMSTSRGYLVCEVCIQESMVTVTERLTKEGVRALLNQEGFGDPLYVQNVKFEVVQQLVGIDAAQSRVIVSGYSELDFPGHIYRLQCRSLATKVSLAVDSGINFREVRRMYDNRPRPLYDATLSQIGLAKSSHVSQLLDVLLPKSAGAQCVRYLGKWLRMPPSYDMADHFRNLCQLMSTSTVSLPQCTYAPADKTVFLLKEKECDYTTFRDIQSNVRSVLVLLNSKAEVIQQMLPHLAALTSSEVGMHVDIENFRVGCEKVLNLITSIIGVEESDDYSKDAYKKIPETYFLRNEVEFRDKISPIHPGIAAERASVEKASLALSNAIYESVGKLPGEDYTVKDEVNSNMLFIANKKRGSSIPDNDTAIQAVDKRGVKIKGHTTKEIQAAEQSYVASVEAAEEKTESILLQLCEDVYMSVMVVAQASHMALIYDVARLHSVAALQKGWVLAEMAEADEPIQVHLKQMSPYWLDRGSAVLNDVHLTGVFLLSAPNMSGKSTLMRGVLVAALLANCGCYVPCSYAKVSRFDNFVLKTGSFDIPLEGKSAFAQEMDDVSVSLRDSTRNSLVMLDEIGRGTSTKDGASLAGAILEEMAKREITGIFATHWHELYDMNLRGENIREKRLGIRIVGGKEEWTYELMDGRCTDSLAMITARECGVPESIIARAKELSALFDNGMENPVICSASELSTNSDTSKNDVKDLIDTDIKDEVSIHNAAFSQASDPIIPATSNIITTGAAEEVTFIKQNDQCIFDVLELMQQLGGVKDLPSVVAVDEYPAVSFEGTSVVYILHMVDYNGGPSTFYVGETESFTQRLKQHRAKWSSLKISAAVMKSPNKSASRYTESSLITQLKKRGLDIERGSDESHVLFGSAPKSSPPSSGVGELSR